MDTLLTWSPEDWTDLDAYEAALDMYGGADLEALETSAADAAAALEAVLVPAQRDLFHAYADAVVDGYAAREVAATRVALVHGIAMGAALAKFGTRESPARLMRLASAATSEVLVSGLAPRMGISVLETVADAFRAAEGGAQQQAMAEAGPGPEEEPQAEE